MDELTYYFPKKGQVITILAGLFMVVLCGFLLYMGLVLGWQDYILGPATPIGSLIVGIVGLAYFSFMLVQAIYRSFSQKPVVQITEDGILDNSSLLSTNKQIPYKDVRKVSIQSSLGSRLIAVSLHKENEILATLPLVKRIGLRIRKTLLKREIVSLDVQGENRKEYEKIVTCINQHRRRLNFIH